MNILIVGGGGREHALGWALRRSPRAGNLRFAPGNAGTARLPDSANLKIGAEDIAGLLEYARKERPALAIIGPEVPLAAGLANQLRVEGLKVFGPGAEGAQLESSKVWAKGFMARHGIPTAREATFEDYEAALGYLEKQEGPYVIKADGLAAGKGVLVTSERAEAENFVNEVMRAKIFGQAGTRLIIEEFLEGIEVSALAFCDTISGAIVPLEPASDYKRAYDGDAGPNTGGMGAYSPPGLMTEGMHQRVKEEILEPTLRGLMAEGIDYRGIVYAGLMFTASGPKVLEYNCRFGDPETQSLLPRLSSDLLDWVEAVADGRLKEMGQLEWNQRPSVGVVLASGGYPGPYRKGLPVYGLENFDPAPPGVFLFHSGTAQDEQGRVVTSGGRVFNLIAMNDTIAAARALVYNILDKKLLNFEGMSYRRDIAAREVLSKGEV